MVVAPSDPAPVVASGDGAMLSVSDLHKSFGGLEVLKGVSLTAKQGDVISMIGASGSGKSTFLRCINLLEIPDSGEVRVAGELIRMVPARAGGLRPADTKQVDRIRSRLGMVFQSFNLFHHMTALENIIEAPQRVLKVPKEEAVAFARELLATVGLAEREGSFPHPSPRLTSSDDGIRRRDRRRSALLPWPLSGAPGTSSRRAPG